MRKTSLLLAAALLSLAGTALPGTALAEAGLPDRTTVSAALDAHPSVQAAQARTTAARAEARALRRGSHEFTFSGSYLQRSVDGEGKYDEFDGQLTRPIRLPGKARIDREIGSYTVTAAENRAEDARHQAALMLAQGWWNWLGAAEEARVDQQAVANYSQLLEAVRRRVAVRDAAQLDADQAEAALGAARVAAEQSVGREAVARARLASQFPVLPMADTPPSVPTPELPEGGIEALGAKVIARSHEIAAADAESRRADASAARAKADRIADPSLGLRLFSERGGAERGAGVLFSMPLGGGNRRALSDRAEAEASAARAEVQAIRFSVDETASADMAEARYRYAAWERSRESLKAQVAALAKLRQGHKAGEIDLADELLGERQVHDAFRAEAIARTEAMRAITRLRIDSHDIWIGDDED
ncbi:TolC family protein [Novosphingobium mangrovi (ex Huang et al. 2023)]|uniref:TolC family protein n=1 Tax=Novosphingobium mangrovi (ex Huang et al. 2023) TaxID=2976432 RepID=A0ABT2I973_9SPHN|nr:TolC family protein [Novosphingobium mangrovi (ex Huang et al. 2023)]MCT2401366.1 TolC family protein [Novosphingobium mangrovi (ex Huang et al. 2023)]